MLVSVLGDSVSTFEGFNPQGYAVFYQGMTNSENGMNSVYDTWWAKVNQVLGAKLCANSSWSGSRVSMSEFPGAGSRKRIEDLALINHRPDVILVYIGFNDFGYGVSIGADDPEEENGQNFAAGYAAMLQKIKHTYPTVRVFCGTLMKTWIPEKPDWIFPDRLHGIELEQYNHVIRREAARNGCFVIDLAALDTAYETKDGSHPTAQGHQTLANAWIRLLRPYF